MTTDTPAREDAREILDEDALARTLARLAHELIERGGDLEQLALVGIHTRGVPLARRLRDLVAERGGVGAGARRRRHLLPSRRRPGARARGAAPPAAARARDGARLRARGEDLRARRRRPLHGPDDPGGDRRPARLRAARAGAARRARRPRAPRAADPARLRRQEPPDLAGRAGARRARGDRRARPGRARAVAAEHGA